MPESGRPGLLSQLRERGVIRVAASYAVIGWLLLQIADVTFEPLGLPKWAMTSLIVTVALGFPVAIVLAWFFELGDAGVTRDTAPAAASRPHVHGARRYADVAIIGVLLAVVAVLLVRQSDLGKPPPPANPTLAVLPFTNLSADPEQQYFSDGLAEEVLDRLGQVPGLMVVARSSSFAFRDSKDDVREIAEKLGVNVVLEGAVRRDGKRLRLSAKLVDGQSGIQLWSGSFDREVNDLFAVQAELAQAVINAIVPVARGDTVPNAMDAPPPTVSLSAYDLYLLGKSKANARWPADMLKSIEYFEQAMEQDPKFAKAQAALALSRSLLMNYEDADVGAPRSERIELAEAAVYKALALDPKLAESQVAYATFLRNLEREGAEAAYKRAIELNPNSAEAWHGYAVFLGNNAKRSEESALATKRAHELDPLAASTWLNYLRMVHRPGASELRRELEKARIAYADDPNTLRRFAIASGPGFPVEAWKIVTTTRRTPSLNVPRYIEKVGPLGLWMYVDPMYVIEYGTPFIDDPEIAPSRLWLLGTLITAHGILGHEQQVLELVAKGSGSSTADERTFRCLEPFWLSVFARHEQAAPLFEQVLQYPECADTQGPYRIGIGFNAQVLPALLRTHRATGRGAEADELARRYLAQYRAEQPRKPDEQVYEHWVRDAALAANEGLQDEAVRYLRQAMAWYDTPIGFVPSLPWFRSLEGHAGYEALRKELQQRVAKLRTEMLALDSSLQNQGQGANGK